MDRIIEVKVGGNYIRKDKKTAGVRGEYEVAILRIEFDESWDEYEKRITFWDARGLQPVFRTLDATRLENHAQSKRVFLVPIPEEPMSVAGEMTFVIDGIVDGKKQRSMSDKLEVKDAPMSDDALPPTESEKTVVEQMMAELGRIDEGILAALTARDQIMNMKVDAETLETGEPAYVNSSWNEYHDAVALHFGLPKGDTGDSGVHIGDEAPSDPVKNVWIAPDDGMNLQTLSQDEELTELMVSIKAFGAVGDGVSNDTEALKAAARYGKAVYFPKGTYLLFEQIDMTTDINWIGEGEGSVIKFMPSENCDMIRHNQPETRGYNISIQGLVLDGNSENQYQASCLYLHSPTFVYLNNVRITGGSVNGCHIYGANTTESIMIVNCRFHGNGWIVYNGCGLLIENKVSCVRVANCEFYGNGENGLRLQNVDRAIISNIMSDMNYHGVIFVNSSNNVLTGVMCFLDQIGIALWEGSEHNTISGLTTEECEYGVLFGDCDKTLINGWNSVIDNYKYRADYGVMKKEVKGAVFGLFDNDNYIDVGKTEENKDLFKIQFIGG